MNEHTQSDSQINLRTYFEDIGAWPKGESIGTKNTSPKIFLAYITGFILSIIFTLVAYVLATHHSFIFSLSLPVIITTLVVLAAAQFIAQIIFFFHLGKEVAARERLIILGFTALIVAILVSGSLWIMFTLNQRMMPTTAEMEQYMNSQEGI